MWPGKDEINQINEIIKHMNNNLQSANYSNAKKDYESFQRETAKLGKWGEKQFNDGHNTFVQNCYKKMISCNFFNTNEEKKQNLKQLVKVLKDDSLNIQFNDFVQEHMAAEVRFKRYSEQGKIQVNVNLGKTNIKNNDCCHAIANKSKI